MKLVSMYFAFLILLLIAGGVGAETLTSAAFQYNGGKLSYLEHNQVYSSWNAKNPIAVHKPGMKVMFFGHAEGCDLDTKNGPVTNTGNPNFIQAAQLTGIPLAAEGMGQRWSPSGNVSQCDEKVRNQVGETFVHVNEDSLKGGIGIFTSTGSRKPGEHAFFDVFDMGGQSGTGKGGRNGKGPNAYTEGTFVTFVFDWQKGVAVQPWTGDSQSKSIFEVRTVQSVVKSPENNSLSSTNSEPIQAKQQIVVSLVNRNCINSNLKDRNKCNIKYLFNLAVYRPGVKNWDNVSWFNAAGIFFDPSQGGVPIVNGPIGDRGVITLEKASGLELYTSLGEPSQHENFNNKEFRIQISFEQFKNVLKLVVSKALKKPLTKVTPEDMEVIYSNKWNDHNEWFLALTNVSQEVHNPYSDISAQLGGAIGEIEIKTSPLNQ